MEEHIENVDYVLMICSKKYNYKAKKRIGGVGYEINLISADILDNPLINKYIPIIRNNPSGSEVPSCVKGKLYCDLNNDQSFGKHFFELVERIKGNKNSDACNSEINGWSAVVDNREIKFKQGEPVTIEFKERVEKYLVIDDDIMCIEQLFFNGTTAYIEVNKDGDIVSQKFPYPIDEYELLLDQSLVIKSNFYEDGKGFFHNEADLKWEKNALGF